MYSFINPVATEGVCARIRQFSGHLARKDGPKKFIELVQFGYSNSLNRIRVYGDCSLDVTKRFGVSRFFNRNLYKDIAILM